MLFKVDSKIVAFVTICELWHDTEKLQRRDTYIAHILRQKVLESLAHRIALGYDALSAIITRARRVSHEGSTTDDALQSLLQRGPEALLTERQGVHNDLFLREKKKVRG